MERRIRIPVRQLFQRGRASGDEPWCIVTVLRRRFCLAKTQTFPVLRRAADTDRDRLSLHQRIAAGKKAAFPIMERDEGPTQSRCYSLNPGYVPIVEAVGAPRAPEADIEKRILIRDSNPYLARGTGGADFNHAIHPP